MPEKSGNVEGNDNQSLRPRKRPRLERDPELEDDVHSEEEASQQSLPQPVRQARPARVTRRRPAPANASTPTLPNSTIGIEPVRDPPPDEAAAGAETLPRAPGQTRSTRSAQGATAQTTITRSDIVENLRTAEDGRAQGEATESIESVSHPQARETTRKRSTKASTSKASVSTDADHDTGATNGLSHVASGSQHRARPVRASRRKQATVVSEDTETNGDSSNVETNANGGDQDAVAEDKSAEEEEEAGEEEEDIDDPEKHQIDTKTLSMYDLSHEGRYGKTSERERKMAQIDWAAVRRKRQEEAEAIMYGKLGKDKLGQDIISSTEEDAEGDDSVAAEPVTRGVAGGVGYRLVNGEIVEDVDSLTIDRAARVANEAAAADETVEEENDLTLRINRTTYLNARKRDETERVPFGRGKSDAWSDPDTDKFYDALTMFGTDFFIISKMFPPRTRKQIKLKFIREERLEPDRINAALLGKKTGKIDLDHYAQAIDRDVDDFHKYDSLEHANQVIRESMKDKEEAMRAAVKEDEENNRQREVQRQQREKHRLETERKKEERARKKAARRSGNVWGTGTMGGADDDVAGTNGD